MPINKISNCLWLFYSSANEAEGRKAELLHIQQVHLQKATDAREYYRRSRETAKKSDSGLIHLSFDYAQQVLNEFQVLLYSTTSQ